MAIKTEQRISHLENEIKAMKACYNTAGSLVKMYVTEMAEITVGGSGFTDMTIRFMPTYGQGQRNLINLVPIVDSNTYYIAPYTVNPQDGSGAVDITIYSLSPSQKVKVIASGSSPGTFSRIS